jgi:hypothetical protein
MNKKLGILACAVLVLVGTTACFGPFSWTRGFDDWANQNYVDSPWLMQLMFYTLLLPAVYTITEVIDIVILNTLDFWGESAFRGTGTPYIHKNPSVPEPR